MNKDIKIVIQDYIPDSAISEFEKSVQFNSLFFVKREKHKKIFLNATGNEISDIIVFFNQHTADLIVGVVGSIGYDILKNGTKLLWSSLQRLPIMTGNSQKMIAKNKILTLHLMQEHRDVLIKFEGEFDGEKLVNKAFEFFSEEDVDSVFRKVDLIQNPDYLEKGEKPRIRIVFNPETDKWEPENFGEYQRNFTRYIAEFRNRTNN